MKPKEKKMILILVAITIVMIIIYINSNKKDEKENLVLQKQELTIEQREDGLKESTSPKLKETKKIENLDVSDIKITEFNGEVTITANITNNTGIQVKEFPINIKLLNKNGELLQEVGAYVGTIISGETRGINASVNMQIDKIYDLIFEKQ